VDINVILLTDGQI